MALPLSQHSSNLSLESAAQELAGKLPALLTEARRVAATVAQGIHGRRRAGPGETFWQFRNFEAGDSATAIDWRRSAGSTHLFVREREWEAAHTVWIWADLSPSMHFRSHLARQTKAERAIVLALALAALLTDGGERVGVPGYMEPRSRASASRALLDTFARVLTDKANLPAAGTKLSSHSGIVILSDFLEPEETVGPAFGSLARQGVGGQILQILDPAEESLPYSGRIEFYDDEAGLRFTAERAEAFRDAYARRLAAHKAAIAARAREVGWTPFQHHTDRPAVEALLQLHMHLSGLGQGYRARGSAIKASARKALS